MTADLSTMTPAQAWMRLRAARRAYSCVPSATEPSPGAYIVALIVAAECMGLDLDLILAPIAGDLKDALDVRLADLTRIAGQGAS